MKKWECFVSSVWCGRKTPRSGSAAQSGRSWQCCDPAWLQPFSISFMTKGAPYCILFNSTVFIDAMTWFAFINKTQLLTLCTVLSTDGSDGKESSCNAGDPGSIPGLRRSPGEGNGYPLKYCCLENSMDGRAWRDIVHGITRVGHD